MTDQIQLKRGPSSQAYTDNFTLAQGEPGIETDTGRLAIGDGTNQWEHLPTIYTRNVLIETGAVTLNDHYKLNVFTGSETQVWSLPPVDTSTGMEINIMHRGSATLTLEPGGEDTIYATSGSGAITTYQVEPGKYVRLMCDGYFWIVLIQYSG